MRIEPSILFIISFLVSFFLTIPTIKFANKFGLVTDKKKRFHPAHTHKGIIPRAGGAPIVIAIILCSILFLPLNKIIIGILIASALLVLMGLIDDKYDSSPYLRFIGNLFISALVIGFGLGIPFISNPLGGVIHLDIWKISFNIFGTHAILVLADIIALVWLTWFMNMVNFSKGVDGQLPGFVTITAFFLGLLAQRFTAHDIRADTVMMFSFVVSGAFLGFLPFNMFPQRIMPGYGGGSLAGFLLGILSILSFGKVGTAILSLAIPMIDAVYLVFHRLRQGRSPFRADRNHFHHRLMEIGWGKRRIAVFYWLVSFILGFASLFLNGFQKLIAFGSIAVLFFIFFVLIDNMRKNQTTE
jgi:UDP-GlcNAc:undecaprenyl-phosphate GlcNAc-1-phosphate transferase